MPTPRAIITTAARSVGVVASGEALTASEAADLFALLNRMMATWRTQALLAYVTEAQAFTLVADQQVYTIGTGGDIAIARPPLPITRASCIMNVGAENELELPMDWLTEQQWQGVPNKNVTSSLCTQFYYQSTFPLARLNTWPIWNGSGDITGRLYVPTVLANFATLTTEYTFVDGYEDAITYNLAVRICPEFTIPIPPPIQALALETLGNIKRVNANAKLTELTIDPALLRRRGTYNIKTDQS